MNGDLEVNCSEYIPSGYKPIRVIPILCNANTIVINSAYITGDILKITARLLSDGKPYVGTSAGYINCFMVCEREYSGDPITLLQKVEELQIADGIKVLYNSYMAQIVFDYELKEYSSGWNNVAKLSEKLYPASTFFFNVLRKSVSRDVIEMSIDTTGNIGLWLPEASSIDFRGSTMYALAYPGQESLDLIQNLKSLIPKKETLLTGFVVFSDINVSSMVPLPSANTLTIELISVTVANIGAVTDCTLERYSTGFILRYPSGKYSGKYAIVQYQIKEG